MTQKWGPDFGPEMGSRFWPRNGVQILAQKGGADFNSEIRLAGIRFELGMLELGSMVRIWFGKLRTTSNSEVEYRLQLRLVCPCEQSFGVTEYGGMLICMSRHVLVLSVSSSLSLSLPPSVILFSSA